MEAKEKNRDWTPPNAFVFMTSDFTLSLVFSKIHFLNGS
jgi:hypothetical protein